MRYLGIDYGVKRVGVALSDETNKVALPLAVVENDRRLFDRLNDIVCERAITCIVLGESKNFKGGDNAVMEDIRNFKKRFEDQFSIPVILEPEFLTSHQAEKIQGRNDMIDASAAALILQSYLDRSKQDIIEP